MKSEVPRPPKWPDKLLSLICKREVLENIQGDLHEIYQKRVEVLGKRKATLLFIRDVITLLRPALVKRLDGGDRVNHSGVFKNHLKTSVRVVKYNPLFSGINVVGLAISMSVGILMIMILTELHSFDDFHEKKDRIYRVTTTRKPLFHGEPQHFASAPHYIAVQIEDQVPGVEQVLVLDRDFIGDLKTDDKGIPAAGYYATASFFEVLSFKLKKGNPLTALQSPGAIVLTESAAGKLFGDADPIDQTITVDGNPDFKIGKVTGVVEDPPLNSHLNFEALVSMKTKENSLVDRRRDFKNNPGAYAQSYVYVVLKEGSNTDDVESLMDRAMADHNSKFLPNKLSLQPMKEFVTSDAGHLPGPAFPKQTVNMMMSLTIVVLLSACFNYTNLSLVRALRRCKEISVRKITGASRFHLFSQFMTESLLMSLLALIVGSGIFFLIKPEFLSLSGLSTGSGVIFLLDLTPIHVVYFILFAIAIGCIAGFLPALMLSKLRAQTLFADAGKIKLFSGLSTRQALITGQIALSIGLITCAVMVHKQYRFTLNYDLGYNTENIVNIRIHGDYAGLLENEYNKMPEVARTSISSVVLGTRNLVPADAMSDDRSDTIMFSSSYIDSRYLDMHGFKLIAGSGFSGSPPVDNIPNSIIVNERFTKVLGLTPQEAIGREIWYFEDTKLKIQGVVRDFVSMSLDAEAPQPFGFLHGTDGGNVILGVKIATTDLLGTITKLESSYKKLDPVHPFEATFYDDQIAKTYEDSKVTYTIVFFLAFLAVSISTLGLLGMAVFTIETRMKEVCIRKVLGAEIRDLVLLLSRSFLVMTFVAAGIATPLALYIVNERILNSFLHRSGTGVVEIFSGFVVVLLIGVLTVGWQVRTAAAKNPTDLLRKE